MAKFSLWSLFFDSEKVTELQDLVSDLKEENRNINRRCWAYYQQKVNLVKENEQLKKELAETKEQLRVQTQMYKNTIKDGHKWEGND